MYIRYIVFRLFLPCVTNEAHNNGQYHRTRHAACDKRERVVSGGWWVVGGEREEHPRGGPQWSAVGPHLPNGDHMPPPKYMDALGELSSGDDSDDECDSEGGGAEAGDGKGGGGGGGGGGTKSNDTPAAEAKGKARATAKAGASISAKSVISYEDLQARGLSRTSLLDIPVPKSNEDGGPSGGEEKRKNPDDDDDDDAEVFLNPFGKWELSRSKRAKLEAKQAEEAAQRRANRGPTWGEQRAAALQAQARHYMTHSVESFDLGRVRGERRR